MITANVAPQDEDWFRYNASCTFFDTCSPAFTFSGSGTMAVFEGRHPGRIGCRRPALPRTQDHTYTVRITGTYGSSYSLNANEG